MHMNALRFSGSLSLSPRSLPSRFPWRRSRATGSLALGRDGLLRSDVDDGRPGQGTPARRRRGTTLEIDGSEFSVGFVRGSQFGGDLGVSYVRKPWKDGSTITEVSEDCFNQAQTLCRPRTEATETQNVVQSGVEVHWFVRFVNIKQRVQIGLNVAGGIARHRAGHQDDRRIRAVIHPAE